MSAARVTAGSLLALFAVGAVVHYRSARHASGDFVSASAIDVDSLDPCEDPLPTQGAATYAANVALDKIATKDKGPCACGKSVCTPGRICLKDPKDEGNDQCYLPRCNDNTAEVMEEYIAGCVCGPNAVFKSGEPDIAVLADATAVASGLPSCEDTKVTTTRCTCGTMACEAGVVCDEKTAGSECGGKAGVLLTTVFSQTHGLIVPGNLTDPTKFAICKNTNTGGKVKCEKDATDGKFCVKA